MGRGCRAGGISKGSRSGKGVEMQKLSRKEWGAVLCSCVSEAIESSVSAVQRAQEREPDFDAVLRAIALAQGALATAKSAVWALRSMQGR